MPRLTADFLNERKYQIQRKNHFEVIFPKETPSGNVVFSNAEDVDALTLLVKSFTLPKENTDSFEAAHYNQSVKLPTQTKFDDSPLVIRDALTFDTEKTFLQWRGLVYNPKTAKMGYAADFKIDLQVVEYSPNGETGRKWTLKGCWPASIEYGDLQYDDGGEKDMTITIKYDYAYRNDIGL